MSMAGSSKAAGQPLARFDGLTLLLDTPKVDVFNELTPTLMVGRGVFATKHVGKGTIIEVSPVLVLAEDEVKKHTSQTCLQHYTYYWPSKNGKSTTEAIALGLGSMFNHSNSKQNVVWKRDTEAQCIIYSAMRDIQVGEELCISYGNGRLWFQDIDAVHSDDEWSKLQGNNRDLKNSSEIELSGIGNIDL